MGGLRMNNKNQFLLSYHWRAVVRTDVFPFPGSPYRHEITLGILQMQESNRLEILKRRWWEGGQCPKEEDHRAKGQLWSNMSGKHNRVLFNYFFTLNLFYYESHFHNKDFTEFRMIGFCGLNCKHLDNFYW